jgi:2-polyprenyl-6-methoxyphenol hydroxylase-like FAD-dependent oxidoreductase
MELEDVVAKRNIRRAVIVGCGIAGPALGMFLRRVGIEPVVCERRAPEAVAEGLFLGVAPNGMNVLAELGIRQRIEEVSVPCHRFEFLNARGQVIGTIDRQQDQTQFGARLQMIRRGDLHRVLTAAAREAGIEVEFGRALIDIDRTDPSKVIARFADGSCETGDVLIGCDGIRSRVRQLTLPDAPEPAHSGLVDFGGITDCELPIPAGVNVMVFGRRAFFGAFKTPSGELWWFHNSGEKRPGEVRRDARAPRSHVLELHREDPPWIRDAVESTETLVGPFPLHDILSMPRWYDGRVGLVGDAAHATTPSGGQGASLALEDAMVMAQCLRDIDVPEQAFAAFENARRRRVEAIVKQSRRNGSGKAVSSPVGEWVRDRVLPLFLRLGTRTQNRAYAYRVNWTQRYA